MVAAVLVLPLMHAAAKFMSSRIPIVELVWARSFFPFVLPDQPTWIGVAIIAWREKVRGVMPPVQVRTD